MAGSGRVAGSSPTRYGPNWRRRFRKPHAARFTSSPQPLPIVGTNLGAPWALFSSGFGPVAGFRGYNYPGSGVPASWPGPNCPVPAGIPASGTVISIVPDITATLAGTLDAALATYFASVPAGAYVCAWAEAEINGYGSAAQNVQALTRLYGIFSANAPASASFGQIVSATSAISGNGGYPLTPWMCAPPQGGIVLDFYGMDVAFTNGTTTFGFTVSNAIATMVAAGVPQSGPWTITEVSWNPAWHGSQNQWYSDGWSTAQAIGAIHYFEFFGSGGAAGFWPPSNRNILPVLQDIAAVSPGAPRSPPASGIARSTTAPFVSSAGTTSLTTTFSSNPVAGSKVMVTVQCPSGATITVADNGTAPGTFWLDACCMNSSGAIPSVFVFRADSITLPGSGTYAVTVTLGSSAALQIAANAYTGVANGPPSATSSVTGSGNNPAVSPVTPDDISSVLFSAFFCDSASNPESMSKASGFFTLQQSQANGTSNFPGSVADALVTSPAPQQGGWMLPDSPNWSAVMAAYGALPVNVGIVPGAEMAWAQAPPATTSVTVNAGLATATGAALPATGSNTYAPAGLAAATGAALPATAITAAAVVAGLASASGWAAVNASAAPVSPAGGLPSASASAAAPAASTSVTAGLASATGAALPATVPAAVIANAGLAAGTGTALTPAAGTSPAAGLPSASAAALVPNLGTDAGFASASAAALPATALTAVTATAGLPAATGAVLLPVASRAQQQPGSGHRHVAARRPVPAFLRACPLRLPRLWRRTLGRTQVLLQPQEPAEAAVASASAFAGLPAATGAALTASVTTVSTTSAPAGLASASGAALVPAASTSAPAGLAVATGIAQAPAVSAAAAAGLPSASAAALVPNLGTDAGLAAAAGAALTPSVTTSSTATANAAWPRRRERRSPRRQAPARPWACPQLQEQPRHRHPAPAPQWACPQLQERRLLPGLPGLRAQQIGRERRSPRQPAPAPRQACPRRPAPRKPLLSPLSAPPPLTRGWLQPPERPRPLVLRRQLPLVWLQPPERPRPRTLGRTQPRPPARQQPWPLCPPSPTRAWPPGQAPPGHQTWGQMRACLPQLVLRSNLRSAQASPLACP